MENYTEFDAMGLAELVRSGQVTPLELVETAVARIEQTNPAINAVVHKMYNQARTLAQGDLPDGPFRGVPFLLKDLLADYAGVPTTSGSRFLRNYVPTEDTELVKRMKAAGLIVLGKTNTPEMGVPPYTEPVLFGPTRNPWDLSRSPGGSSGGSAAAVAARMVPMAGGGDGGGSLRIPASCCGIFGLKPTRGRVPTGPKRGELWEGFVVEHVLTRSVRDSAAMLDAVAGPDVGAPYVAPPPVRPYGDEVGRPPGRLRIAFTTKPLMGTSVHPDCVAGVHATVKLLDELGHTVEEAAPAIDRDKMNLAFAVMLAGQTAAGIQDLERLTGRALRRSEFEPVTWALYLLGGAISAREYALASGALQVMGRRVAALFQEYDVLLTPTIAQPPAPIGSLQPSNTERRMLEMAGALHSGGLLKAGKMLETLADTAYEYIPYTIPFNLTGQPAMSVPLHWNDAGLPIGMQFAGRFGDEATLFRLAGQLEQARPWGARRPPAAS